MKTLLALSLAGICGAAVAQTPAINPMPDGSRDMYLGVGVISAPRYLGAAGKQSRPIPLLQVEWSNGVFVSGMSAGMHLSRSSLVEFGPLIALHPGRDNNGDSSVGAVTDPAANSSTIFYKGEPEPQLLGMAGVDDVPARLTGGAFLNYYLHPQLRLTSTVLAGAGRDRRGAAWHLGLQRTAVAITPHHRITLAAGMTMVNRAHNDSFFGVTDNESRASGFAAYSAGAGVRDLSLAIGWNWSLSPQWMLASGVRATRLRGDARLSPLVERPTHISVSTGFAFRF